MIFFAKMFTIRRFSRPEIIDGYQTQAYSEMQVRMNVQEQQPNNITTGEEGKVQHNRLQGYSNMEFKTADNAEQTNPDWLLYKDDWYECVSCNKFDNTVLDHFVSSWTRVPEGGR